MNPSHISVDDHCAQYVQKDWSRSIYLLVENVCLHIYLLQFNNLWLTPILGLNLVSLFIIYHDLGHGSFFPSIGLNNIAGRIIGCFLFTPFSTWTATHALHHAHSNNLDKKQYSQTSTLTVEQYMEMDDFNKILYKLFYGKYTLFLTSPAFYFFINLHWNAYFYEIVAEILYIIFLSEYLHPTQYLYVMFGYIVGGIFGMTLFHTQHTFDGVYKKHQGEWNRVDNGLNGSSHTIMPFPLNKFSLGIEYHHIHHINPKIPVYKLEECHENGGVLFKEVKTFSVGQIFNTYHYSLYNERNESFVDVHNY